MTDREPNSLHLSADAMKQLVENIREYQTMNPADDAEFKVMMRRLRALSMMLDDLLVSAGEREPLTDLETEARLRNRYYQRIVIDG